ncbi:helix-turn-helix domain-containing protein [Pseudomonas aeruginosa]|uniref:helix-turn-helix domain-containing protein n=1 Tax=Pseudomonas aeruginosa TaxID=287 RepID=UPI003D9C7F7F
MPRKEPGDVATRIGQRLRAECVRLRLSTDDASAAAGCSRRTWQYFESGQSLPDAEQLYQLALVGFDVLFVVTGRRPYRVLQVEEDGSAVLTPPGEQ